MLLNKSLQQRDVVFEFLLSSCWMVMLVTWNLLRPTDALSFNPLRATHHGLRSIHPGCILQAWSI